MWKTFEEVSLDVFAKRWHKYNMDRFVLGVVSNGLRLDLKKLPNFEVDNRFILCQKSKWNRIKWDHKINKD